MAKTKGFGKVLAKIRQEQGFPTAHAFYKTCDGRRTMGLTFRNYLNLEQDKHLPEVERFRSVYLALGLNQRPDMARRLVEAYFEALGLDEFARLLHTPDAAAPGAEGLTLAELAARHEVQKRVVHYTAEQWKMLADNFDAYLCDDVLNLTAGGVSLPELAKRTGLSDAAAKKAVKALVSAGLAKSNGGRAVHAVDPSKVVAPLPSLPALVGVKAVLRKSEDRVAERGTVLRNSIMRVRLTETNLRNYEKHLDHLIDLASLYSNPEPAPGSALYMVRGQLIKIYEP